jgi:hypothetical protein
VQALPPSLWSRWSLGQFRDQSALLPPDSLAKLSWAHGLGKIFIKAEEDPNNNKLVN